MAYTKEMENADIERDVFIDFGEQVIANFSRYFVKKGIKIDENKNDPAVQQCMRAVDLVDKAYGFTSEKEVEDAYAQLDEIRRFYRELQ